MPAGGNSVVFRKVAEVDSGVANEEEWRKDGPEFWMEFKKVFLFCHLT